MTKHLYIHIPFCKSTCLYCDFVRHECNNKKEMNNYIVRICTQIKKECNDKQFKTIYIGGGTPNFLSYENLEILLKECKRTLENSGEFTIECNPEFINQKQIDIFRKYSINRISLGVQSTNDKILKTYNRHYTISIVKDKIKLLYKNKISNISCDFIYGFNELTNKDLYKTFNFIVQNKIKHVSFYSLEIKDQSILKKNNYKLDDDKINEQFVLINKQMENKNYKRYEVSNFALSKKYESQHNKAYWKSEDWKALGVGAYGLENRNYYHWINKNNKLFKKNSMLSIEDYYFQVLSMGLRLCEGINLKNKRNLNAYKFFKSKLTNVYIKNEKLSTYNINFLNSILEKML